MLCSEHVYRFKSSLNADEDRFPTSCPVSERRTRCIVLLLQGSNHAKIIVFLNFFREATKREKQRKLRGKMATPFCYIKWNTGMWNF